MGVVICSNSLLAGMYEICDLIGYFYFMKVVEELDSHNLGVGALQGDILLVDLKLRPDALVSLHVHTESSTMPKMPQKRCLSPMFISFCRNRKLRDAEFSGKKGFLESSSSYTYPQTCSQPFFRIKVFMSILLYGNYICRINFTLPNVHF
jgi:hypothetical protein